MILISFDKYTAEADIPPENETLPGESLSADADAPVEDTPPADADAPAEDTPPADADDPAEEAPPTEKDNPSEEAPPAGKDTPAEKDAPAEKDNPSEEASSGMDGMQEILDSFREELSRKDADMDSLSDSLRSLVTYMAEAEEARAEAQAQSAAPSPSLPIPGWEGWDYPVTADFTVYPWGMGRELEQRETYSTPEAFRARYEECVSLCREGGTLKDYYIRYIYDCGDNLVYDYQPGAEDPEEPLPEEPGEDLSPLILEALQSADARLEAMEEGLSSISANTAGYCGASLPMQEKSLLLNTYALAVNISLCLCLFVLLGYHIAHGTWQRMRAG